LPWHSSTMDEEAACVLADSTATLRKHGRDLSASTALCTDFHDLYRLDPGDVIGTGSFGSVCLARLRADAATTISRLHGGGSSDATTAAMGLMDTVAVKTGPASVAFAHEAELLASVQSHPNVILFAGIFQTGDSIDSPSYSIVTENCPGGDLYDFVMTTGCPLPEQTLDTVVSGLLSGVSHVHGRGIVHRDVKLANILIGREGQVVLADFGVAARKDDSVQMARSCGSIGYAAPELLAGESYDEKVDMFSVGVVLFFVLARSMPWPAGDRDAVRNSTIEGDVRYDHGSFRTASKPQADLVRALLQRQPEARPSAAKCLLTSKATPSTDTCSNLRSYGGA